MRQHTTISRDDALYHAWPDVTRTSSGRLVCVFCECTHHGDRSYSRLMFTVSTDGGRTWTAKRPFSEPLRKMQGADPHWNCPRVVTLADGRLVAIADRVAGRDEGSSGGEQSNWLWYSNDEGEMWTGPHPTPVYGIVPDRLTVLRTGKHAGRWVLAAHTVLDQAGERVWTERCWHSDDRGATWHGPYTVAAEPGLKLCEGSIFELPQGELVCLMRENSMRGLDAYKTVSRDGGATWSEVTTFPLPGCHRPVGGLLADGRVLVTYRFCQGGKGWLGWWTQNTFAAVTDTESCLAAGRQEARARILPLDFDRSPRSDTGYTGWIQLPGEDLYIVNYIVDDAPKGQIRGYRVPLQEFGITDQG